MSPRDHIYQQVKRILAIILKTHAKLFQIMTNGF